MYVVCIGDWAPNADAWLVQGHSGGRGGADPGRLPMY